MKKKKNRLQRIFALKLANQSSTSSLSTDDNSLWFLTKSQPGLSTPGGGTPLWLIFKRAEISFPSQLLSPPSRVVLLLH